MFSPVKADILPLSSKSIKHYGIGVLNMPKSYTVYQYPYKDNYMINFGTYYENKTFKGYKISLVDISDPNNIKEVGKPILFDRDEYTRPLVLNNPKELFLDLNRGIFGFSIMKYRDYNNSGGYKYSVHNPNFEIKLLAVPLIYSGASAKACSILSLSFLICKTRLVMSGSQRS